MKYKFEQLLNRSYEAIKKRGLITDETTISNFLEKINEESFEVIQEGVMYNHIYSMDECHYIEELIDLATVCFMQVMNLGYDPIEEFRKVVEKNESRANIQN
jgi:NTP pyrophosphatase (non-canonical NTP hydrolase)